MDLFRKSKNNLLLSAVLSLSVLAAVPSLGWAAEAEPYTQKDLNNEGIMAVLWQQTSAEYRELCYQAYNVALMEVEKAVAVHKTGDKPLAIVLDCDETVLDNSAFFAGNIGTEGCFSSKAWTAWVKAEKAKAMPGAAEYLQSVDKKGVQIFYVTNRRADIQYDGTAANMKKLGFPQVDREHLILKTDNFDKLSRFQAIAEKYDVVVYMGDNEGDMPFGTYGKDRQERNAIADAHKAEFGVKYIVLPNPIYGDWKGALAKNYYKLTPEQKAKVHQEELERWRSDETASGRFRSQKP